MEPTNRICKNCETPFDVSFGFCPHCGQKAKDDLTIGVLFYNTISNYFSFDARFFRSFVPLMFKPGYLAKEFVSGKRLRYLHPAQYYLFVSVVFFFILSFKVREYNEVADKAIKKGFEMEKKGELADAVEIDSTEVIHIKDSILNNEKIAKSLSEEDRQVLDSTLATVIEKPKNGNVNYNFGYNTVRLDSLINAGAPEEEQLKEIGLKEDSGFIKRSFIKQVLKFHKQDGGGIVRAIFDTIPIALFFLLPIFAFILMLFYWRKGSYSHHLVFSFYYFSYLFIVLGFLIGVNYFIFDIPGWIEFIIFISTFVYLWLSMKRFYEQGYFITFIKAGFSSFIYLLLILPFAVGIIVAASFFFY